MATRILVCDDQPIVRTGYTTVLAAEPDLDVVGEAVDGQDAIDKAHLLRPDIVVMDVRMPRLNGIEATRQLAGAGAAAPVKVLVVTTFNVDGYVYEALRAGASGFLLKDSPPAHLVAAVRAVSAGEALLDPRVTRRLIGHFATRIRRHEPAAESRISSFTPRETEVLRLIGTGLSNAEIAAALVLSRETVKTYVSRILTKLDLRDRVHAVILAYRLGLVDDAS